MVVQSQTVDNPVRLDKASCLLQWRHANPLDVYEFRIYLIGLDSNYNVVIPIARAGLGMGGAQDTAQVTLDSGSIGFGKGFLQMTAVDTAGNESNRSETIYYTRVIGAPFQVRIIIE